MRSFVKLSLAVILLTILAFLVVPPISGLISRPEIVDQGGRPLIVITSSGGDRAYALKSRMFIDADGGGRIVFQFTADNVTYGENDGKDDYAKSLNYDVYFAGVPKGSNVKCGADEAVTAINYEYIAEGAKTAIRMDTFGGTASATTYSAEGAPVDDEVLKGLDLFWFHGWSWEADSSWPLRSERAPVEDADGVWAEACTFDAAFAWRWNAEHFQDASERTLLPPQINFTSTDDEIDYQSDMYSDITVHRGQGFELLESNPEFVKYDSYYFYESKTRWSGGAASVKNVAWTDQPVQLFRERGLGLNDDRLMLWVGIAAGLGVTLVLYVISRVFDLVWVALGGDADG